ncbi:hypothetical protein BK662_29975 [Pseudomonas frederiksbergensis]|uniref:Uncharacterized protein n=1 Tax=Pseudomonas frederiksbergensis TaxID=104087 RepID=A0A423HG03_9PSED|nr:hypothetical protein BK662_29975 [Pseudomonas frederiksbergensis]
MTTDTGMTTVGTIVEMIGAETTGVEIIGVEITGVESKPAEKRSAIVTGSATRIGSCGTATRTIATTIVASASQGNVRLAGLDQVAAGVAG